MKKTLQDKELYFFALIVLLFFGIYCRMQYAPDTYYFLSSNVNEMAIHFASCGRFITAILICFTLGNIGALKIYVLSYIIAIICTTLSLYILNKIIKKDVKNDILSIVISTLIIINPFSIELFVYIEKGIMMLSILFSVLAFKSLVSYFENKDKKSIIIAMLFMLLANCCYQGTVGIFVSICVVYAIKYAKNIKDFVINNIIVLITYGIPAVINFLLVRIIFSNSRISGEIVFSESISKMIIGIYNLFKNNYGILPIGMFAFSILMLVLFIAYKTIKDKTGKNKKVLAILGAIYIVIITTAIGIAPQILQNTESIWFVPRSTYSVAAIIGVLSLYLTTKFELKKVTQNIIIILLIMFLTIQLYNFINLAIDGYIVGNEDKNNAIQIIELINKYEAETNKKINKIALYQDKNPNYTYSQIRIVGDINIKAFASGWATKGIIKYYSNRNFEIVEKNKDIEEIFNEENWDSFFRDQIIIKDETVHICNY